MPSFCQGCVVSAVLPTGYLLPSCVLQPYLGQGSRGLLHRSATVASNEEAAGSAQGRRGGERQGARPKDRSQGGDDGEGARVQGKGKIKQNNALIEVRHAPPPYRFRRELIKFKCKKFRLKLSFKVVNSLRLKLSFM